MKIADPTKVFCEECNELTEFEVIKDEHVVARLIEESNDSVENYADQIIKSDSEFHSQIDCWPATAKRCPVGHEFLTFEIPALAFTMILQANVERRMRLTELKKTGRLYDAAEKEVERRRQLSRENELAESDAAKNLTPVDDHLAPPTIQEALSVVLGEEKSNPSLHFAMFWSYVKKNRLQDKVNNRIINADRNLQVILGKDRISMYELGQVLPKIFASM